MPTGDLLVLVHCGLGNLCARPVEATAEFDAQALGEGGRPTVVLQGLQRLLLLVRREGVQTRLAERLVDLDVLAVPEAFDDAALATVQDRLPIAVLQPECPPFGDHEGRQRCDEQPDAYGPGDGVDGNVQVGGDHVVGRADEGHEVDAEPGHSQGGRSGWAWSTILARRPTSW
ncbi:hypothetical protein ASR50_01935 [Streptomyces sp. 4F]|uniref:Uncharacterized protein n=1 Tax=Streptomyces griseorubens TaxID=66897 RepID=A0ABR4TB00_9ACTN|nr:hypothetical protein ASR50_01935 [Streptomyces sp. 4F]KEG44206.1 hypothetical protein DJ64_26655 [Streptomyces griseorubens]